MTTDLSVGEAARIAREAAMMEALQVARAMRLAQDRHFLDATSGSRATARDLELRFDRLVAAIPHFPATAEGGSC